MVRQRRARSRRSVRRVNETGAFGGRRMNKLEERLVIVILRVIVIGIFPARIDYDYEYD